MAALEKVFQCLTCKQDIKLERKPDNSGWIRYNLDGSLHKDEKKQVPRRELVQQVDNGSQIQIVELAKEITALKETVGILISQIQSLRSEVKQKK